jgi:hypothetical protein
MQATVAGGMVVDRVPIALALAFIALPALGQTEQQRPTTSILRKFGAKNKRPGAIARHGWALRNAGCLKRQLEFHGNCFTFCA